MQFSLNIMPLTPCAMTAQEPGDGARPIPALQRKPHPKAMDAMYAVQCVESWQSRGHN